MNGTGDGSVLVVGAGWLGGAVAEHLARRGRRVVATNRRGVGDTASEGVQWAAYDSLRDGAARLAPLVAAAESVIVCWAPSGGDVDRRAHYVGGAAAVIAACADHLPQRLVYTSSTSALADRDGEVDENCDEWPKGERGRIQREAEEVIRSGSERLGVAWFILRLAGIYGPGRELDRIYRWQDGSTLAGDGAAATNLVHRDDVVRSIEAALAQPPSVSAIVHVCDDDHTPRRKMFAALAEQQGRPTPQWEFPPAPTRGKRVANRKLKQLLGVKLSHPAHRLAIGG